MDTNTETAFAHAESFLKQRQHLILATVDAQGMPLASTTPFVMDVSGDLYIFVSQLAQHTQHLQSQHAISVMLVEDESECRQAYARKRLTLTVDVSAIERDDAILNLMQDRFGGIVELLKGLADFQLFRLTPKRGNWVEGFGKAFDLDLENRDAILKTKS